MTFFHSLFFQICFVVQKSEQQQYATNHLEPVVDNLWSCMNNKREPNINNNIKYPSIVSF